VEGLTFVVEKTEGEAVPGPRAGEGGMAPGMAVRRATLSTPLPGPIDVTCALVDLSDGWLKVRLPKA
jgi:hypothetical protein